MLIANSLCDRSMNFYQIPACQAPFPALSYSQLSIDTYLISQDM
ncbi:hypothetical protein [Calothrix sp. UHCC 0171]|nr:hypothetical protein [Calothrix sp. UHCC 0171]MEA5569922.1 hypothetical protein [Calothrix sp. UHCC 0171]